MTVSPAPSPSLVTQVLAYGAAVALAFGTATLGSVATQAGLITWYPALAKPWFNPPNWVFPVAWTALFLMIAIAGGRLVLARSARKTAVYVAYLAQMALNAGWSIAFFTFQSPLLGLAVIIPFWGLILLTIVLAWRIDRMAAILLLPYWAWVSFAAVLNAAIWNLNG